MQEHVHINSAVLGNHVTKYKYCTCGIVLIIYWLITQLITDYGFGSLSIQNNRSAASRLSVRCFDRLHTHTIT